MVVTLLGQQSIMSGRSPPLYCTLINRHAGTPDKKQKQNRNNVGVVHHQNGVVIIYCFIGCSDNASTWYLNGFPDGSNLGSTVYVGEKPTVTLYTYIDRHAGTPEKKQKQSRNNVVQHPTW